MFLRLCSLLTDRFPSSKISLAIQPRLVPLYQRSFPTYLFLIRQPLCLILKFLIFNYLRVVAIFLFR